jgi:Methylase involved in ubiquinone/menaquinone biosynthesis
VESRERIIGVFDSIARSYDEWYAQPAGQVVLRTEARMLDAVLPRGLGVEVGAGTCVFPPLLSRDREIVCLDPALGMLSLCRGRCPHPVAGTAEEPPLRRGSLDFAYMVAVLEFLENPGRALAALGSLLKRGGVLAVLFIERESSWGRLYRELAEKRADPVLAVARFLSLGEVISLVERSGFRVLRILQALDYKPLAVPEAEPRIYEGASCSDCGVALVAAVRG